MLKNYLVRVFTFSEIFYILFKECWFLKKLKGTHHIIIPFFHFQGLKDKYSHVTINIDLNRHNLGSTINSRLPIKVSKYDLYTYLPLLVSQWRIIRHSDEHGTTKNPSLRYLYHTYIHCTLKIIHHFQFCMLFFSNTNEELRNTD